MLHIRSIFPSAKQIVPFYDFQTLLFAPLYNVHCDFHPSDNYSAKNSHFGASLPTIQPPAALM